MKKLLALLLFTIITFFAYAENDFLGKIKGVVIDSETNQPMEYASIAIYNTTDSTLVTGGISSVTGQFEIKGLNTGTYYVIANFVGYNKLIFNNIKIDKSTQTSDLGTLILKVISNEIAGVDVIADKQRVEYKIDKKVVNVSQDINAAGGTAVASGPAAAGLWLAAAGGPAAASDPARPCRPAAHSVPQEAQSLRYRQPHAPAG